MITNLGPDAGNLMLVKQNDVDEKAAALVLFLLSLVLTFNLLFIAGRLNSTKSLHHHIC